MVISSFCEFFSHFLTFQIKLKYQNTPFLFTNNGTNKWQWACLKLKNYSIIHFVKIAIFIIKSNSSESFSLFQKSLKVAHKIPLLIIIKLKLIHDHKREIFFGANFHFEICTLHYVLYMCMNVKLYVVFANLFCISLGSRKFVTKNRK